MSDGSVRAFGGPYMRASNLAVATSLGAYIVCDERTTRCKILLVRQASSSCTGAEQVRPSIELATERVPTRPWRVAARLPLENSFEVPCSSFVCDARPGYGERKARGSFAIDAEVKGHPRLSTLAADGLKMQPRLVAWAGEHHQNSSGRSYHRCAAPTDLFGLAEGAARFALEVPPMIATAVDAGTPVFIGVSGETGTPRLSHTACARTWTTSVTVVSGSDSLRLGPRRVARQPAGVRAPGAAPRRQAGGRAQEGRRHDGPVAVTLGKQRGALRPPRVREAHPAVEHAAQRFCTAELKSQVSRERCADAFHGDIVSAWASDAKRVRIGGACGVETGRLADAQVRRWAHLERDPGLATPGRERLRAVSWRSPARGLSDLRQHEGVVCLLRAGVANQSVPGVPTPNYAVGRRFALSSRRMPRRTRCSVGPSLTRGPGFSALQCRSARQADVAGCSAHSRVGVALHAACQRDSHRSSCRRPSCARHQLDAGKAHRNR